MDKNKIIINISEVFEVNPNWRYTSTALLRDLHHIPENNDVCLNSCCTSSLIIFFFSLGLLYRDTNGTCSRVSTSYRCLEVFAREMATGWTYWEKRISSLPELEILLERLVGYINSFWLEEYWAWLWPILMVGVGTVRRPLGSIRRYILLNDIAWRSQHLESDEKPDTTTFRLLPQKSELYNHLYFWHNCTISLVSFFFSPVTADVSDICIISHPVK